MTNPTEIWEITMSDATQEHVQHSTHSPSLVGRVAAVTGSSSGHGRAIARALAAAGAAVVCSDLRREPLPAGFEEDIDQTTDEVIVAGGGQASFVRADVTVAAELDAVAREATSQFGRLDIWVNNAGIFVRNASVVDETEEEFDRTLAVNLKGTWLGCKAALRAMREQEPVGPARGRIINIGSIAGDIGQADLGSYSASKGAVHNLTRALAIECAPLKINVNAIAPGYFPTAMNRGFWEDPEALAGIRQFHPWPELGDPADVGAAVAFLASDAAQWITGAILPVDGGVLAK
jgi:NAD(P)-dependent dehydrogenase (short-subunit alcohol dehydrogenase family)